MTGRRHRRFWKCLETLPAHVLIGIGSGPQEKLAHYIIERLSWRPVVHCIRAALGCITGDQIAIPDWADRFYLGWLLRLLAQPRLFAPCVPRKMSSILNGKLAPAVGFEPTARALISLVNCRLEIQLRTNTHTEIIPSFLEWWWFVIVIPQAIPSSRGNRTRMSRLTAYAYLRD